MTNDITVGGLAFKMIYPDKDGSLRRETSRGASLPTELMIKHLETVNSKSKLPSRRTLVRFDYYATMSTGIIAPVSYYSVSDAPIDTAVTSGVLTSLQALMTNLMHGTTNTNGLDLQTVILVNREQ